MTAIRVALLRQYGIEVVLLPKRAPLSEHLRDDPAWAEKYADQRDSVFARR